MTKGKYVELISHAAATLLSGMTREQRTIDNSVFVWAVKDATNIVDLSIGTASVTFEDPNDPVRKV
jgi:hypothetical protein